MRGVLLFSFLACGCAPDRVPDLKSADPYSRALGVLDLGIPPADEAAVRRVLGFLEDPHPLVRDAALIALSDLGEARHVRSVVPRMKDPDEEVRVRACITLGEMKVGETVPELAAALRTDASPRVRRHASEAIAIFGAGKEILDALADGAKDSEPSVRFVCRRELMRLTARKEAPGDPGEWKKIVESPGR